MKNLTLVLAAIVMGFVMTSCNTTSKSDTIKKATDEFFSQAETKVQAIDNGVDFLAYIDQFEADKAEFLKNTFADYLDEEGNVKGFTEEEWNELQGYIYDRATAYNKVEAQKAAEFMTPLIEDYENAINALCEGYGQVDEASSDALIGNFEAAEAALRPFANYDNVLPELQQRAQAAEAKLNDFLETIVPAE